jgi:hypothetical protein
VTLPSPHPKGINITEENTDLKKAFASFALLLLVAGSAFAHAGEVHTYLGTVTKLDGREFMMKTREGKEIAVETTRSTKFLHADNHRASLRELRVGSRVVVKMAKDNRTASSVKMAPPKNK